MIISSLDNEKIKLYNKLKMRKYRDKLKMFMVEGEHLVLEAYKKGCLKELILEQDTLLPLDVETVYVTNDIIIKISLLESPTKILGLCSQEETQDLGNKVLMLDNIQDAGNLGTIIRSAVAFGVDNIILGDGCVDLYNEKVIRASQGMIFHINVIKSNIENLVNKLKESGYPIIGTKVTHGKSTKKVENLEKYVLIVGNEGAGISEILLELCDEYLYIPMNEDCESLNVGVATSIILYELDKR